MTMFPVVLGGILYLMQPTMHLLFVTPIGWGVLAVMVVMLTLGYMSIKKIVAIDI
jgi:tight adherence protein B